jgi:hypothetical protein
MEKIKIFVLNIDQETLDKALQFLKEKDYEADGEADVEKAIESFQLKTYDIAVLGGGINGKTRELLKKEFAKSSPEIEVIEHVSHPVEMYEEMVDAFKD